MTDDSNPAPSSPAPEPSPSPPVPEPVYGAPEPAAEPPVPATAAPEPAPPIEWPPAAWEPSVDAASVTEPVTEPLPEPAAPAPEPPALEDETLPPVALEDETLRPAGLEDEALPPAGLQDGTPPPVAPIAAVKPRRAKAAEHHHRSFLRELPFLVVIAFVLALLIKHFLVQAFYIPSGSMEQTLMVGDRVLVNKVPYHFRGPHRGEIVVFNGLDNFDEGVTFAKPSNPIAKALRAVSSTIGLGTPDEKDYIKRVIGIQGDRVMCCDTAGRVVVTPEGGRPTSLEEPYVFQNDPSETRYFCEAGTGRQNCPPGAVGVLVPEGRLWVLGDHRSNSSDSRFHLNDTHRGTVPEDKVVGRAFAVVYPFDRAGILRVPKGFDSVALPAVPWVGGVVGALPLVALRRRYRSH